MTTQARSRLVFLGITLLATAAAAFVLPPPGTPLGAGRAAPDLYLNRKLPWQLGLDLIGGSALVYDIDLAKVPAAEYATVTAGLADVVERRINLYGVGESKVRLASRGVAYQLHVELPGVRDLENAVRMIGETPVLDFRENCMVSEDGTSVRCVQTELTGRHIAGAELELGSVGLEPVVSLRFNDEGAKLFEAITERNVGQELWVFLDNIPVSHPIVREKIAGGKAQISGGEMSREEAKQLVERFNAGALTAPITLVNQRTVDATAAHDSLDRILVAGAIGTLLIALFMAFYYRSLGLIAGLALLYYIALSLALFKVIPGFVMTLAGISGFLLSIGMAIDANILVFERAKEEMARGVSRLAAIEVAFARAWPSIRDSNVSTIITSLILYSFTSSFVKGFALTLMLGVGVSIFSALTSTRAMIRSLMRA